MGSWKQQIEAQIADLRRYSYESDDPTDEIRQLIDSMHSAATQLEALLDVAVAANEYEIWCIKVGIPINKRVQKALDKLREVSDD